MKRKIILKALSLILGVSLLFTVAGVTVSAAGDETEAPNEAGAVTRSNTDMKARTGLSLDTIRDTRISSYSSLPLLRNGTSMGIRAYLINGIYYIPVRDFINKNTSMSISYTSATRTVSVSGSGFSLSASDGSYVVYANDRALFEMTPARIMSDGKLYIPLKIMAKALGLSLTSSKWSINVSGTVKPLTHARRYYDQDSVLWLSRIISAESRGEPLLGQIAVGNVILNRVKSPAFPNTIWGVIFDRKYGIQFSPVANGAIYNTPTYNSTLAAKIVLEGFRISPDILYFLAPRYASSSWISNSRPYVFTIQNHEFYA